MNPRAKSPRRAGWALPLVALVALTGCGELVGKVKGLLGEDPAAVKAAADAALAAIDTIKNEIAQKVQDTRNEIAEAKAELKKAVEAAPGFELAALDLSRLAL